ncbi:MAG: zinc ribbon domain-containing protein [Clostridiales bacterium]|jgi:ribosomal protein L40E|nr:zinc ribbon domain-containing protein [Clostridiales bacterium]
MPFNFSKLAKDVTKSSSDFLKTTKMNMQISSEEGKLNDVYIEIGKKVSDIYCCGGSIGGGFDELYKKIKEIEDRIQELNRIIEETKGEKTCAGCGETISREVKFCPKCGQKTQEGAVEGTTENSNGAEPNGKTTDKKICVVCGAESDAGNTFCSACGGNL